jgi:lipopolysaccharide biosynthesis glycosyltransferase
MSGALSSPRPVAVAFCADSLMEVPLHVAAFSLLRNLSVGVEPHFYMLLTGFTPAMENLLRRTLDGLGRPYRLTFLSDEKTRIFSTFRALLGNYATYYRLLLPDLIDEPDFLYVDSDTLVLIDVAPLFAADMGPYAAGFVVDGHVKHILENKFFISLGRDPDGPAFNAGVMLVQRSQWKEQDLWNRVKAFCEQYSDKLLTADQTVLNALLAENCYHLPPQYNIKVYPKRSTPTRRDPGLYHFVGAPKPWDLMGRTMLPCGAPWFEELARTPLPQAKKQLWRSGGSWRRLPHLLGSYKRLVTSTLTRA